MQSRIWSSWKSVDCRPTGRSGCRPPAALSSWPSANQPWTQDQAFLLPPSLRDWLAEDHLAWFILDVVSQLDLSAIERAIQSKDARGQRPYRIRDAQSIRHPTRPSEPRYDAT